MSEFKDLYKSNILQLKDQQAKRRAKLLDEQRQKRENNFAAQRNTEKPKFKRRQHHEVDYRNNLMLSEWMMEAPDDLEDFQLVPCPKGIRCTLSNAKSRNNLCKLYYKSGGEFLSIRSNIPRCTVLDCIYTKSTIFVLDVISYDGRDFFDCDTSFRSYWIKNKFLEDDLKIFPSNENENVKLLLMESFDFNNSEAIFNCFQTYPHFDDGIELDGFLFYHKEASYTVGESPLVLWLFPFMVEDVLPMFKVNEKYNSQKPDNYTNYLDYIYEFNLKLKNKRRSKDNRKEIMDVEEVDEMQKMIDLEKFGDFE